MLLTIEKLIYGGDGLARLPGDGERGGKALFVPFVLPGEQVEAHVSEQRKGFARARLESVVTPSPERVAAPCPYYGACGGCQYQHASYDAQLAAKREILRETVLRGAKVELPEIQVHSAEPYGYRNRTRMKVTTRPEFAVGYFRHGSNAMIAARECPISSPLINRAVASFWAVAESAKQYPELREIQWFANHDDSQLLLELHIDPSAHPKRLEPLAREMMEALPQIAGVTVFANYSTDSDPEDASAESERGDRDGRSRGRDRNANRRADRRPGSGTRAKSGSPRATAAEPAQPFTVGEAATSYHCAGRNYRVSAGSFFQTNRFLAPKLVEIATAGRSGSAALDLFAGTGLFTLPLSNNFERVTSVEIAPSSFTDLRENTRGLAVESVRSTTADFLRTARGRWDFALLDPPRAGLGERAAQDLAGLRIPQITYVSCDPSTLSRDLKVLAAAGYRVEQAHLVDMFPQTFHMETVLHLAR